MNLNVINDSWMFVRYQDNTVKQISVRQAFIDAHIIKDIETPTFHEQKVYLYDIPVIQLLVTILLAAYFKPENNFQAQSREFVQDLLNNDWDLDLILRYLDQWQDRFNLFDDQYPFLQDITLNSTQYNANDLGYLSRTNLVVPAGNNLIFEHATSINNIEKFLPSISELVYILLYNQTLGTSPMPAAYPNKSLCANQTMWFVNKYNNLKKTIIYNCLSLRGSFHDDDVYDKPVWEFTNKSELNYFITEYGANLYKQRLLCSFFPSLPMYICCNDANVVDQILIDKKQTFTKEIISSLMAQYVIENPWTIMVHVEDKKTNTSIDKYKEWTKQTKLINLCIEITKHTPHGYNCNLLTEECQNDANVKCIIYYREYDGMKANVLSYGKYEVSQNVLTKLCDQAIHSRADNFQTYLKQISSKFNLFKESELSKFELDQLKTSFMSKTENYFFNTFIQNIDDNLSDYYAIVDLLQLAKKEARTLSTIVRNPLKYATAFKLFYGSLKKIKEELDDKYSIL